MAPTLWRLVGPYIWQYRRPLLLCVFLNSLPGFVIAAQALPCPSISWISIFQATGVPVKTRYLRLGLLVGGYLFAAIVMRMFAWYGSYRIFTKVRENVVLELRARFFRHINNLCLRFHGKHSSGELFTYVMGIAPERDQRRSITRWP